MRGQFGVEMEDVLAQHLEETAARGWIALILAALYELLRLPGVHIRERIYHKTGVAMETGMGNGLDQARPPVPWGWSVLGMLPFLFVLLAVLYGNLVEWIWSQSGGTLAADHDTFRDGMYNAGYNIALVAYIPILITGWVRAFPVWIYPFMVQFIVLIAVSTEYDPFGTNIARLYRFLGSVIPAGRASPGMVILGNILWLLNFLGPLAVVAGVSLFLTRNDKRRSFREGLKALTHDLTRLSFGIFALAPLFIPVIWDGIPGPRLFSLLPHLLLGASALIYLRARHLRLGVTAVVTGFVLSYGLTIVFDRVDWSGAQAAWKTSTSLVETLTCVIPFFLFTLGPWMIHRYNQRHPTGGTTADGRS